MNLYICGNGFDLHHRLKTSYSAYRKYLEATNPAVMKGYGNFPGLSYVDGPWADVESALSIDYEGIFSEAVQYNYPDVSSDSDSRWSDLEIVLDEMTRFVNDFTGESFFRWLNSVDYAKACTDLTLPQDAMFLTFNYTNTIERLYGIPSAQVFHIHGTLSAIKTENCIGSSIIPSFSTLEEAEISKPIAECDKWNCDCIREELQFGATDISVDMVHRDIERIYGMDDFYGASIEPALRVLESFVDKTTKNVETNIPSLQRFINGKPIDKVIVMGVSLHEADMPYYTEVLIPAFRSLCWMFMRHCDEQSDNLVDIQSFINQTGLANTKIVDW